jgi:hypothetical protein
MQGRIYSGWPNPIGEQPINQSTRPNLGHWFAQSNEKCLLQKTEVLKAGPGVRFWA